MNNNCKQMNQLMDDNYHHIDFVPTAVDDEKYSALKKFILSTHAEEYAIKISKIALKLCTIYETNVYFVKNSNQYHYVYPDDNIAEVGHDISNLKFAHLADSIINVLSDDSSSITIHTENFHITISSEFNIIAYGLEGEDYTLVKKLVNHEGLFLREYNW